MIVLTGIALFLIGWLAHVIIWRVGRPANSSKALILVLVAGNFAGFLALLFLPSWGLLDGGMLPNLPNAVYALLVALSISASYVMTYPALEVPSPILVILTSVAKAKGSGGVSLDTMRGSMTADFLVLPRIQDLLNEKFAVMRGERIVLTKKGRAMASLFLWWRGLLNRKAGG